MAAPARIIALNIGSQTVSLADFRGTAAGGIVLNGYRQADMGVDGGGGEARGGQVQEAIRRMTPELGIRRGNINYAVTAQSVFTRFVKLPSVEEEKVGQIIQFEAQQNVPFPIHEVVWDYQLVGADASEKIEVVLVAIKSDLLNEVNESVEAAGFRPTVVDVAPMALYNAFRYNYSDVSGCSLIVDIGAKTTNLIFSEPRKVFSRSIPIGGATITLAISKELKLSPAEAEDRKKKQSFVSLGGAYADPEDPDVARMSKITRNAMTRLHAEINRSISFYRAQQQGSQPTRVYLAGGGAGMPYMREFFAEKLQMPIEYLNPLRNVAVTSNVEEDRVTRDAHSLGELVGLALRDITDCPMELNLRPLSVVNAREIEARKPFLVMAAVCFLLALGGWWFYFFKAAKVKGEVVTRVEARVTELQGYEARFKKVRKEVDDLKQTAQPFATAAAEREYWATVFDDLRQRLPERFVWITVVEPSKVVGGKLVPVVPGGKAPEPPAAGKGGEPQVIKALRIKGLYLDNERQATVVDKFVEALAGSPVFEQPKVVTRATPTGTEWAYPYELEVGLKTPIALP